MIFNEVRSTHAFESFQLSAKRLVTKSLLVVTKQSYNLLLFSVFRQNGFHDKQMLKER